MQLGLQAGPFAGFVSLVLPVGPILIVSAGGRWFPFVAGGPFLSLQLCGATFENVLLGGASLTVGWRHFFGADWYAELAAGPAYSLSREEAGLSATFGALPGVRLLPDATLAFGRRF